MSARLRVAPLAVALCLGLNACVAPEAPPSTGAGPSVGAAGRAEAIGDFIVVRQAGSVRVLARLDAKPLWSVPQPAGDPIAKARLAQGSIVVVRRSQRAEVYDLKTGILRFSKEGAGAVGVSWTMLYADSAACQPDCGLRGYDLATGQERWVGPKALRGNVMAEIGESPDDRYDPPGGFEGPLRAPEAGVVAVRAAEGLLLLEASSGQELSRVPIPEAGLALGSEQTLVQWITAKDGKVLVLGHNVRSGEVVWQEEASASRPGRQTSCPPGWRPEIADGLLTLVNPRGQAKVIQVDTGAVHWLANPLDDPAAAVSRQAIFSHGPGHLRAFRPDKQNASWVTRLWTAEISETGRISGLRLEFDRLLYTTEYAGSPSGIGWVRDALTGRRLWVADGLTPLGVDGDRVIAATPSGEIRLERMDTTVSTG